MLALLVLMIHNELVISIFILHFLLYLIETLIDSGHYLGHEYIVDANIVNTLSSSNSPIGQE